MFCGPGSTSAWVGNLLCACHRPLAPSLSPPRLQSAGWTIGLGPRARQEAWACLGLPTPCTAGLLRCYLPPGRGKGLRPQTPGGFSLGPPRNAAWSINGAWSTPTTAGHHRLLLRGTPAVTAALRGSHPLRLAPSASPALASPGRPTPTTPPRPKQGHLSPTAIAGPHAGGALVRRVGGVQERRLVSGG
ncbi:hypothetical protein NDU88_001806 [Pleurodeles waltl]|uniref:Uncharacterized protein n=1 Tax=Pleurodeles waltl TaxID=8319 RepID=A0AAV7UTV6_PLEWA|nr:hypothetical protein NDU88_001806 [Pleurodeles waltl]